MSIDIDYQKYSVTTGRPLRKQQRYSPWKCILESLTYYESKFNLINRMRTGVFEINDIDLPNDRKYFLMISNLYMIAIVYSEEVVNNFWPIRRTFSCKQHDLLKAFFY
jgi:hypothetical protein